LNFLINLIKDEREKEKNSNKDTIDAEVVDVSEDIATLRCEYPKFEEGDVIGMIKNDEVKPFGIVLTGGTSITVKLYKQNNISEGQTLKLCEAEILIGYDLQLDLMTRIINKDLNEYEQNAYSLVFEKTEMSMIKKVKLNDRYDVKRNFPLDDSQCEAVEAILGLNNKELLLIIGPPGTGKTYVIAKAAIELAKRGERVLITSHTNRAVDNAIGILPVEYALRVGRPEKILPEIRKYLLGEKAKTDLGSKLEEIEKRINKLKSEQNELKKLRNDWYNIRDWKKHNEIKNKLYKVNKELSSLWEERNRMLISEYNKLVSSYKIIGSTLIKSQLPPLGDQRFDTVIIDECSQVSIPLALLGMIKAKKWVLVGDPYQLLPIFKTLDDKDKLRSLSIFCYLLEKYNYRSLWLRYHYRSNNDIIGFSQIYVYNNRIKPVDNCKNIKLNIRYEEMPFLNGDLPVVFLNIDSNECVENGSKYNEKEAKTTEIIVSTLKRLGLASNNIGVITPYRAQRNLIAELLGDNEIEVNTVDSFQGREKDVIIFSVTSTEDMSFVEDENRLNVAFTRARKKLIVIGNAKSIEVNKGLLAKFIAYAKEKKGYFNIYSTLS
jgi:predicted DNA helicase